MKNRRPTKTEIRASLKRGTLFNTLILGGMIVVFLLVPLVITRSIIFLEPEQALGILALIGALVVVVMPRHDRPCNTRLFFYLLVAYVACYVCWPNWVAIDLPLLPFLTPARAILLVLLAMWTFSIMTSRTIHERLWQRLKPLWPVWVSLLVLLAFRGFAIPFSPDPGLATKGFLDQIVSLYLPLMMAVTMIESERDVKLLMEVAVIVAVVIGLTVIYEAATKENLFTAHLGKLISYEGRWIDSIFTPQERLGKYRSHGPFMVHLSMAEFYVLTLPFILYWLESTKKVFLRVFLAAAIILSLFVINATDSRTAMICSGLVIGLYCAIRGSVFVVRNRNSNWRPLVALIVAGVALALPLGLAYGLHHLNWQNAFGDGGSRAVQFQLAIPKVLAHPVIGYGSGLSGIILNYRANGRDLTIDNYFLSVVLDAGIPAVIAFTLALASLIVVAFRNAIRRSPVAGLYLAFLLYFLAFGLVRTTLSESSNLTLVFMMMGAFMAFHSIASIEARSATEPAGEDGVKRKRRRPRVWHLARGVGGS